MNVIIRIVATTVGVFSFWLLTLAILLAIYDIT